MVELKKPKRIELLVALVMCIMLVGASIYANLSMIYTPAYPEFSAALLTKGSQSPASTTTGQVAERRRNIGHWIKGELRKGTFPDIILSIENETEVLGGYIYSEDLMYSNGLWHGEIVSKVPQNKSARFVFRVEEFVTANGEIAEITTRIRDISQTSSSQEMPYATIRVILKEVEVKQGFEIPVIPQIAPYLNTFFVWVLTGMILGLPTYFTILGIVLLIDRALLPVTSKLFKRGLNKAKETS